jgi:hypothetical protein
MDGTLPRPSDWVGGPGGIKPDGRPWSEVAKTYAFVDELAALRGRVQGPGNLERFDYWLNTFRYMRANAQVNCTWATYNQAMEKVKAEKDPDAQQRLARQLALPLRKELVAQVAEVHEHLLSTVTTHGTMGTVTNWQQHILPGLLTEPGEELAKILGEDLPVEAMPVADYQGPPRIFLPTVRTCLKKGEPLRLEVRALGEGIRPTLYWRPLGSGEFAAVAWADVSRGVYRFEIPGAALADDFEYYVEAEVEPVTAEVSAAAGRLLLPSTAPQLNQTVVVVQD